MNSKSLIGKKIEGEQDTHRVIITFSDVIDACKRDITNST